MPVSGPSATFITGRMGNHSRSYSYLLDPPPKKQIKPKIVTEGGSKKKTKKSYGSFTNKKMSSKSPLKGKR